MVESLVPSLRSALSELLPRGWRDAAPWGHPGQSELALVAGVFGAQLPAHAVDEVVDSLMRHRPGASFDDLASLAAIHPRELRDALGARWGDTTVLGVPRRRADVVHDAAVTLVDLGVRSSSDLGRAAREEGDRLAAAVQGVRGLGPGTWASIAFMAHAPALPGDAVIAAVRRAVGAEHPEAALDRWQVAALIRATASRIATDERVLGYALSRGAAPRLLAPANQ